MPERFKLGTGDEVEFEYVVNPSGAVHDVAVTHASTSLDKDKNTIPVVQLAREGKEGWRLATKDEITAYRKRHLIGDDEAGTTRLHAKRAAAEKAAAAGLIAEAAEEAAPKKGTKPE